MCLGLITLSGLLLLPFTAGGGPCGYPGRPENGIVSIAYDTSDSETAHYQCSTMSIDGDITRKCDADGKWTGDIPRCGSEVSRKMRTTVEGQPISSIAFTDDLKKCEWISAGTSFRFLSDSGALSILEVTVVSPIPYKDALKSSTWTLDLMNKGQTVKNAVPGTFQENPTSLINDRYCSIKWNLNGAGDEINLTLRSGNVYACKVFIFAIPDECGPPERPVNGRSAANHSHVFYSCDKGFHLSGNRLRTCSHGRWTGYQPTCIFNRVSKNFPMLWHMLGPLILCLVFYFFPTLPFHHRVYCLY